jgi:hypothetical protein
LSECKTSINQYFLDYANAEVARLRDLNDKLLAALQSVAQADSLEAAQEIACTAIAIAITIVKDESHGP